MTKTFLPRDPTAALVQVKERLYSRLMTLRQCMKNAPKDKFGYIEEYDRAMANEIDFLEETLDEIERSL